MNEKNYTVKIVLRMNSKMRLTAYILISVLRFVRQSIIGGYSQPIYVVG